MISADNDCQGLPVHFYINHRMNFAINSLFGNSLCQSTHAAIIQTHYNCILQLIHARVVTSFGYVYPWPLWNVVILSTSYIRRNRKVNNNYIHNIYVNVFTRTSRTIS